MLSRRLGILAGVVIWLGGSAASGAPGGIPGPPEGGGGGTPPVDLGDLVMLYRDSNGVPIVTPDGIAGADTGLCQQPIAFPSALCPDACVVESIPADVEVVAVDQATCAVSVGCESCTQEVEFGRINEARSPDTVFETQLADVVVNLATADCVTLDPAGRLVTSRVDDTTLENLASAIDSPLQNLAIYRQLVLTGFLGDSTNPIALPGETMDTAARALGAASDKSGGVDVDLVAYLNQIMGLSDPNTSTIIPKRCIDVREEVAGVVQVVQKCFLDYGNYEYTRAANFATLPAPAYIPEGSPVNGWFEYLSLVPGTTPPLFEILQGPIPDAVFGTDPGFQDGNIGGFAQAADDARAVIEFMHSNPVPADFQTPVVCEASGAIAYDVSISPDSGLQVPVRYVNGTEREFTVTVANAGPDVATGTITLSGVTTSGDPVPSFPRVFTFTDLASGTSTSFTELFTIDLGSATTITWTATAVAEYDVNALNNTVTATTVVKMGGGSGGSRRP